MFHKVICICMDTVLTVLSNALKHASSRPILFIVNNLISVRHSTRSANMKAAIFTISGVVYSYS